MQHLDEGTIHAWLDGELSFDESQRVVAHAEGCDQCTALITEARGYVAASSRILRNLDDAPAGVIPPEIVAPEQIEKPKTPLDNWGIVLPIARRNAPRRWIPSRFAAAAAVTILAVGTYAIANRGGVAPAARTSVPALADGAALQDSATSSVVAAREAEAKVEAPPPAAPVPVMAPAPADQRNEAAAVASSVAPGRQTTAPPPAAPPATAADARGFAAPPPATAQRVRQDTVLAKAAVAGAVAADSGAGRGLAANRARTTDTQRLAVSPESVVTSERRRLAGEVDALRRMPVVTTGAAAQTAETRPPTNMTITTAPGCYDLQRGQAAVEAGVPAGVRLANVPVRVAGRTLRAAIPLAGGEEGARWYWSLSGGRILLHKVVGGAIAYEAPVTAVRRGC